MIKHPEFDRCVSSIANSTQKSHSKRFKTRVLVIVAQLKTFPCFSEEREETGNEVGGKSGSKRFVWV